MNILARLAVGCLTAYAGLCAPHAAHAATKTAAIAVSAEVIDTCNIAVSGMARADAATCALATPYRVVTSNAPAGAGAIADANSGTTSPSGQANRQDGKTGVRLMTIIF